MVKRVLSVFTALFAVVSAFAGVAKIGDTEYATIDAAIDAWKEGDEIKLLCNIDIADYFVKTKNFVIDGCGYTLKCTKAHDGKDYFVNNNGYTQTFKNITIDGNKQVAYAAQCINTSSTLILDNVTIKGGKTTLSKGLMGYGLHINKGNVIANDLKVSNCDAAAVYIDSNKAAGGSFTLTGDNCDLDAVGVASGSNPSLSITAKGFSVYDVSVKYSYWLLGTREKTETLSNVISSMSWNFAIAEIEKKISGLDIKIKSATVTLKGDVKFKEAFTSNESRLTVDGAGKTVTGKFIFNSSTPTTIKNIVLGNGSVLDCTASTKTGFSSVSVAANTSIDILLPASTDMNSYALPVSLATDAVANIFVGDKKYIAKNGVISAAEKLAQIGDKQYATLQEAIDAANGAVIQVLKDVALTSSLTVPAGKTLTLNLAGRKVTISGANYALVNNGNLTIVDMGLVTVVAAEATIGDETATPILIMAPSANDGVAVIDDATGGSIAGVQNNGTFALESGAVVAASASVPAIDNTANAVATITGGTVEGKLQSVDKTALTITGGSFTGESNVSDFVGGDYGVDSNGTIVKNVAKIGEAGYLTLEDAIAAATEGDTITLFADINYVNVASEKDSTTSIYIPEGKKFTLDLNGYTISGENNVNGGFAFMTICRGADVTVDDTSDAKSGKITYKSTRENSNYDQMGYTIRVKGILTLNNGMVENSTPLGSDGFEKCVTTAIDIGNASGAMASFTMNGGVVISETYFAIRANVYGDNNGSVSNAVVLNGGTVYGLHFCDWGSNGLNYKVTIGDDAIIECGNYVDYLDQSIRLIIGKDARSEIVVDIAENAQIKGSIYRPVAKVGSSYFYSIQKAVAAAQAGDTVVVIGATAGEAVVVDKDLTITGEVTLTDVSINGTAGKLTVSNLTFVGNSWINAGGCDELVVENVTANVAPSNKSYTNSREAFISLGRNEGKQLKLTVTDCNIVVPSGSNAVLGWAAVTEVVISGNTFGSEASYQNNGDIVKFMAIADGAVINITNNTSYSNYNGFVFAQNTTRDNSYSVYVSGNTFYGGADHIWIEISGGDTVHAKVETTSDNTVNGNKFTVADIKYHYGVIKNWDGYAGVDVTKDSEGKLTGGSFLLAPSANTLADGFETKKNADGTYGVAANPAYGKVAKIGDNYYATLADALAAAKADDEIELLADVNDDLILPANVILAGNGKQITGTLYLMGDVTIKGHVKANAFDFENVGTEINIPAGATFEITGTGRMIIGHGCTFNITGTIVDAKTADKSTLTPSLVMPGASFTGAGVTFNVKNAYITAPSSYCSSSKSASGTFDFNIENSIIETAGKLAFEAQSMAATVNFELKNSVLNTGSHLVFGVAAGEVVIDNSNVNVGKSNQLENRSTMTIKNGSIVNGAVATSSNAINSGTIIVENATYAVTGQFSGSTVGTGTLIIKQGANVSVGSIVDKANIQIDATGMSAGDEINFTANLSKFAGTVEVINNDKLEASIVDGKIVLSAKPVAKIGDTPYSTLEDALNAAKAGDTVEIIVAGNYELKNNYVEEGAYRLPNNFTLKGMVDGVVVTNGPTIRANNLTIDNVDFNNPVQKNNQSGLVFYLTGDSVIKNSDIYGYWGASYYSVVTGTLLVDNCTFDTQVYGLYIAEGNADVTVKNSVIAGWNTYGSDIRVTFTGCTFKDNRGYYYLGFYGDAVIEDCKFEENMTIGSQTADAIVIDISNSKVVDDNGDEIAEKSIYDIIEQDTLDSDVVVKIDNIHVNGKVAKIGETTYATLADALAAAQTGDTVVLLAEATGDVTVAEGCEVVIDLNGNDIVGTLNAIVNNGTLTINDTVGTGNVYTTDVSAQGRAAIVNRGTIVINGGWFGDANNDTSDRNAINRGNALKNYGTAIVNGGYFTNVSNQYIGSDAYAYAINTLAGGTTVINEATVYGDINGLIYSDGKTTVNGGSFTLGRPGEENNLWYLAYGDVVIKGGTWTRAFKVPSWNPNDPKFNGNVVVSGGDFNVEIPETYRAEGYQSVKQPGKDLWQVGKLPNAEVINVGPYTVDEESYYIYNITNKSFTSGHKDEFDLQVTLGFIANDTVEEAAANAYGQYLTDFRIKIEGIENGSFVADKDCYLAGYYPFFGGWVKVNLDGMTIENNVGYPVITGVTEMPFTYETICDIVKSFICGIHLSDEVLQANPNLKVSLELGLAETQEKMLDGTGFVTVGDTYDYTVEELTSAVALTGADYYTTVDDAVAAALETGDFVKLVKNASLKGNLEFGKKFVLDLGGKTLAADGKTLLIDNSYVVMTNGTLDAFTTANVTLAGNAILTVTDAEFANNFRALETHYVSANANGTYSIMLKTAFRSYITVVDGKARVGFFKDGSASYTIKAATNLETPEWDVIQSEEAADAADVSELPLYWVKTTEGEKEYRFFKLSVE